MVQPIWSRGTFSIIVTQPLTSDTGLVQYVDSYLYGIAAVACSTDQGTVTINLDIRSPNTPNTAGTNVLPSSLECSPAGTASFAPETPVLVPANAPVDLEVLAVSGMPNVVRVFVSKSVSGQ